LFLYVVREGLARKQPGAKFATEIGLKKAIVSEPDQAVE
jgi:hypothetical protein